MDDDDPAAALQQFNEQHAPLLCKFRVLVNPFHAFFRMEQQGHRFVRHNQICQKTDDALTLALVARIVVCDVSLRRSTRTVSRYPIRIRLSQIMIQFFVIDLPAFTQPGGK